jgi:lactate racemase
MSASPRWDRLLRPLRLRRIEPGRAVPKRRSPIQGMARALRAAGCDAFLRAAVRRGAPVTLVVNDPHRATDTGAALAALWRVVSRLRRRPRFRVLVAAGSHRFGAAEKRRHEHAILGGWRGGCEAIAWHRAGGGAPLRAIGRVRLHPWVTEGFALAIGSMEPHYFAGVTGAHKTLTVGLMSLPDLTRNHRAALARRAEGLRVRGNPVFEGIARVLRALQARGVRLLVLNQILSAGRVVGWTSGDPLQALRRGLPLTRRIGCRRLRRPADLVVARVAPPLDRTLYQADKGIKNVETAVRDGGTILLEARCAEGVGMGRFLQVLRAAPDLAGCLARIARKGYRLGDHKAVRLRRLTERRRVRLGIVSRGLPAAAAPALGAALFRDPSAAALWALRGVRRRSGGPPPLACLVEDAGNVMLVAGGGERTVARRVGRRNVRAGSRRR